MLGHPQALEAGGYQLGSRHVISDTRNSKPNWGTKCFISDRFRFRPWTLQLVSVKVPERTYGFRAEHQSRQPVSNSLALPAGTLRTVFEALGGPLCDCFPSELARGPSCGTPDRH